MGFRFRKSIKIGPARINLSKSGIGYSVGTKGFRVTKKAKGGTRTTASLPGTGISYSTSSSSRRSSQKKSQSKNVGTSTSYRGESSRAQNKGCLTSLLWIFGGCLAIALIRDYWWALVLVGLIVCAFIVIRKLVRERHNFELTANDDGGLIEAEELTEETPALYTDSEKLVEDICDISFLQEDKNEPSSDEVFQARKASAIAKFTAGLKAVPLKFLTASEPAPRQLLKDLPPYGFSNVTRKTRLDSIFPLVVLDVETTGLRPSSDEIVEISAIKFDAGMIPVEAFTTLCKPKKSIPPDATAVNHITDEMVQNSPRFAEIASAVTEFLSGCHLAGHNLDFDLRFIHANGVILPEGTRFYDTLDLAHLTVPSGYVWDYKLDSLCHYYSIWREDEHRSLSDCYATALLFAGLVKDKTERQLFSDPDSVILN